MNAWTDWAARQLDEISSAGRWRATRSFDAHGPAGDLGGRPVVSFASNDYLGLSSHPAVAAAAHAAIDRWGTGSTASRLVVGTRPCHDELEDAIAEWKGTERAVVYPTGYAANLGVMSVLGGTDVTVFSDELNHASIIDGCRLGRSAVKIYPHCDVDRLDAMLGSETGGDSGRRTVVVTDGVFSMDGDEAPIGPLATVCARHGALLVIDEAHSVLSPSVPVPNASAVIRVGTLSKALGALGGWVAASSAFADLLVNRSRPYIFTTALPPADAAAALAALEIVRSPEGHALVSRLRSMVERLVPGHPSPIVPLVLGDEARALDAAAALLEHGILVPAIRPPTVPVGSSRLRITVSAGHSDEMLDRLVHGLDELGLR